jgi:HAD superfamily hydrolase (TIGR01509 family)
MTGKTIVFDFGGVLFRTSASDFFRDRFAAQGRSEDELRFFLDEIFTKADRSAANTGDLQQVLEKKALEHPAWSEEILAFGANRDFVKQVRSVLPGMKEVLEDIRAEGDRIVGLTNWAGDAFDTLPSAFPDILQHFNKVVVSGKVHIKKPALEIFQLAQEAFGNPDPATVFYFDDKSSNIEAATKAVGWQGTVFENADSVRRRLGLKPKG